MIYDIGVPEGTILSIGEVNHIYDTVMDKRFNRQDTTGDVNQWSADAISASPVMSEGWRYDRSLYSYELLTIWTIGSLSNGEWSGVDFVKNDNEIFIKGCAMSFPDSTTFIFTVKQTNVCFVEAEDQILFELSR